MSGPNTASGLFTCITCHVAFKDPENQRAHFQTEWHSYNLKRKVASMKPVTKTEFESKVEAQQIKTKEEETKSAQVLACQICHKEYATENAYTNHIASKKHKEKEQALKDSTGGDVPVLEIRAKVTKAPVEEQNLTEDELIAKKIDSARKFAPEDCLFCPFKGSSLEEAVSHMTEVHSLYIPDIEYLVDLEGLIEYLGEKISIGNVCLFCSGKGKSFHTLEAVQKHMIDKGHCKLAYEGESELEYSDFYDFRPSYPDYQPGKDDAMSEGELEELEEKNTPIISENEVELVLPSGARLGHRSLNRYYKQHFRLEDDRTSSVVNRMVGQYRALGWHTTQERSHEQIMQLRDREWHMMDLGVKANRLQRHFRRQVDY